MSWEVISTQRFTYDLLDALIKNEIAAVRVPDFVSPEQCRRAIARIPSKLFQWYEYAGARANKVSKIGIVQNEHKNDPSKKEQYFKEVEKATRTRQQIFQDSGDLLYYVIGFVKAAWGKDVRIAEEGKNQPYFAGIVRTIGAGALHFDWARLDAQGWAIEKISDQLTWNIYLQLGTRGGTTVIYRRYGQEADKKYKVPGSIHTDYRLVEGGDSARIMPEQGELVFFNPRNYHVVEKTEGQDERITFSSFFGLLDDTQSLVFWS